MLILGWLILEEDLFLKYNIVDIETSEGQKIHNFLAGRAEKLSGRKIDFSKYPVAFVFSDDPTPNAFFVPAPKDARVPRRNEDENVRYIKNPLDKPVIGVTRGLIDMIDNLDQLDYVLGHEITHRLLRTLGITQNSKGEEGLSDLHAVDLVYDSGGDPKEALKVEDKFLLHAKEQKREIRRRRRSREDEPKGINWSEILDVHMTHNNRKTALQASLTRLSHLIDDRKPASFDRSIFDVRYTDPVEDFLKSQNYSNQKAPGKLKILIDCVEHLSTTPVPPDMYYGDALKELKEKEKALDPDDEANSEALIDIMITKHKLQRKIDEGFKHYFSGQIIEKKYQQKIAALAQAVFLEVEEQRADKNNLHKPARVNTTDLDVYLQDKAYKHIKKNGYPEPGDHNYLEASGILYTFLYNLFGRYTPHPMELSRKKRKRVTPVLSQIEIDILDAQDRIRTAKTSEDLKQANKDLQAVSKIYLDLKSPTYQGGGLGQKFDNLSFAYFDNNRNRERKALYPSVKEGQIVPWNNLVQIAKESPEAREYVIEFLKAHEFIDYRITHDIPYIKQGHYRHWLLDDDMRFSKNIAQYELDYILYQDEVLAAYDYIRAYFKNEETLFDKTCQNLRSLSPGDFEIYEEVNVEHMRKPTVAEVKIERFVTLYNSLPANDEERERYYTEVDNALSYISTYYRKEHPVPGSNEKGGLSLDSSFFDFTNPVFTEHFGDTYKAQITGNKDRLKQKMFETAFQSMKIAVDIWGKAKDEVDLFDTELKKLDEQEKASADEHEKKKIKAEERRIIEEREFRHTKLEICHAMVRSVLRNVIEHSDSDFCLKRLTDEQREILGDYVVADEKGILSRMLGRQRYMAFCNYRQVLSRQIEAVVEGNYTFGTIMQTVASNLGYEHANDKEGLIAFANKYCEGRYNNNKYQCYMHMIDAMRHLEETPDIDVHHLAKAIISVQEDKEDGGYGADKDKKVRYDNYKKLVLESRFIPLMAKAIDFQDNYKTLSVRALLDTADTLAIVRKQMAELLEDKEYDYYYGDLIRDNTKPEHKKFLALIEKNIRGIIRRAEYKLLQNENRLERLTDLYRLYRPKQDNTINESERNEYIRQINQKDKTLASLQRQSKSSDFWPVDVLEHIKAYVFAKETFLDDNDYQDEVLNALMDKLEELPEGSKKDECFYILLDQNLRAPYPETRDRLFALYSDDVVRKIGKDDSSKAYQDQLKVHLKALDLDQEKAWDIGKQHTRWNDTFLSNKMSYADKYILLKMLSDKIISQEKTSVMIQKACEIKLKSNDMLQSYLYGIGVDAVTELMDSDSEIAKSFLSFLNSKGEKDDCRGISDLVYDLVNKSIRDEFGSDILIQKRKASPEEFKIFYENFWAAPIEARSVIVSRILKSAVHEKEDDEEEYNQDQIIAEDSAQSWERVFEVVMDTIIAPDDTSVESRYARDIMYSYIKARSDYERELILSAMMVANRNIGKDAGNVGKALKLFLENMGPAEIKLGQAIASHPNTPEGIKKELQNLKNMADIPPRWVLFEWIRTENIPEELWKNTYLGEILGSASYYTTVELGLDNVLRILRPEAREKAIKGFRVISDTIEDLRGKDMISDLDYAELTASVSEMVTQAARMSEIETDQEIGEAQYKDAKKIYNGITLKQGDRIFKLKVMDWHARGQNWVIMERAKGVIFNALPEDTSEQRAYKKDFAKAYIVFEISRILSGRKFDHDKHGAQLCVESKTGETGIFDTGAMAITEPGAQDQRYLGHVLYDALNNMLALKKIVTEKEFCAEWGAILSAAIDRKIEVLHEASIDTQYLVEIKKGVLALGDFFNVLEPDDLQDLFSGFNILEHISKQTKEGLYERMSISEKAQIKIWMATQSLSDTYRLVASNEGASEDNSKDVRHYAVKPTIPKKSDWFQDAFESANDNDGEDGALLHNFEQYSPVLVQHLHAT